MPGSSERIGSGLSRATRVYAFVVIVLGVLVATVQWSATPPLPWPLAYFLPLLALIVVAECFPMRIVWANENVEFTISTTFIFAGVLAFGTSGGLILVLLGWTVGEVRKRKESIKVAFNVAQATLSASAAGWVYHALEPGREGATSFNYGPRHLASFVLAALAFYLVNAFVTAIVRSLALAAPLRVVVRTTLKVEMALECSLLLLAPLGLALLDHSPALVVILALPLVALYMSLRASVENLRLAEMGKEAINAQLITERALRFSEGQRFELEERMQQSQKLEAVGQLAGGVAHDFNNLLSIIENYASFARDEVHDEAALRQDLDEVVAASKRGSALVRQLLAFSRKDVIRPQVLDLNEVITSALTLLKGALPESIEIDVCLGSHLPPVEIDPSQLEQILVNLTVNARDAMPEGGLLEIRTTTREVFAPEADLFGVQPGIYTCLHVGDSGRGMTESVRRRIFEPFFTTKERGSGTGLGLATVYGIVHGAEGHISVDSRLEAGSTFTILLPVAEPRVEALASLEPLAEPLRGSATVLVVEDEPAIMRLAERILSRNGYKTLVASDARDALKILEAEDVDLVLTDVVMPQMSGKELATRMGLSRPDAKVIYMSGYSEEIIAQHGLLSVEESYLQKPFSSEDLLRRIDQTLSRPTSSVA
jgi:signal transduction histidine kinase/ActR/RegA family two-component response regulator